MSSIAIWTRDWAKAKNINNVYWQETDSTNTQAKQMQMASQFLLFLAEHQTSGRGRNDRRWSDAGEGHCLLSSWTFKLNTPPQPIAAPLVGLMLYESAALTWPTQHWSLKAPNDLFLNDKKVAGLLVETVSQGNEHRWVVGLGMNVMSHPGIERSGCLSEIMEVNQLAWSDFLDRFFEGLTDIREEIAKNSLGEDRRLQLIAALNRFPLLAERYTDIYEDGSLATTTQTIRWSDL